MRILVLVIIALNFSLTALSQGIVISGDANATPHGSAMLDVQSTEKGFLPPRMTTIEREAIINAATGLVVYDTNENSLYLFDGTEWVPLVAGTGSLWEANLNDIFRSQGNVGIGLTNPAYPFHVETNSSNRAIYSLNSSSSGITYGVFAQNESTSGVGVQGNAMASSGTNYGVYGRSNSSSGAGVYGRASATSGVTIGVRGRVDSPDGYAGYFIGTAGSLNYFQRAVGIGTTSPNELLEVSGNIHVSGGDRTIFNRSDHSLALGTNNTERIFISNTGNVGIGTTTPNARLEVNGDIHLSGSGGRNIINRINSFLAFGTNNTERVRITNIGRVGIGTTTPNVALEVNGDIHMTGEATTIFNRSVGSLAFGTNNTERMRISIEGRVGIGTTSPLYAFHVVTTSDVRAIYGHHNVESGTGQGVFGQSSSSSGEGVRGVANATSGLAYGVSGRSNSNSGRGVNGMAISTTGTTYGVYGSSTSTSGRGVYGSATADNGTTYGVYGTINSPDGFSAYFIGPAGSRNYFSRSVGIGTINPGAFLLAVSGDAAKNGGGSWSNLSDERLKTIHGNYQKGLSEVLALQPVRFNYLADNPMDLSSDEEQIGFVAQRVQHVFPEAVQTLDNGYLSFNMHAINVALVNSIKELSAIIEAQNARIETLENIISNPTPDESK